LHLAAADTALAVAQDGDDVVLLSDLGLHIVPDVVGVVTGEVVAARRGALGLSRVHDLDVGLVSGINDGRDVKVSLAVPATELDLTQHARAVVAALGNSVEVADKRVGEVNRGILGAVDIDRVQEVLVVVGSEVNGTLHIVNGAESDLVGAGESSSGTQKGKGRSSEMHFEWV
jgi:ApbE superfamily uncharacterized protein (UPF0280 family)